LGWLIEAGLSSCRKVERPSSIPCAKCPCGTLDTTRGIANLVQKGDTTGVAHLANDVTEQFDEYPVPADPSDLPVLVQRGFIFSPVYVERGSLTFTQFFDKNYAYGCGDTITDSRDGKKYPTVCIGEQVWMAKNLDWAGAGVCFNSAPSYCNTYGRLYTWDEVTDGTASTANPSGVKGICPAGWHVPSLAEWQTLINHAGGELSAGDKLRANSPLWADSDGPGTDDFGFAALPGGQCQTDLAGVHDCFNDEAEANMWTASKESGTNLPQYIGIYGTVHVYASQASNATDYFSCRCVKD